MLRFLAKFPHSPIHHYTSIYGALLFSVSPVRCTCIIKYGAVRKFFLEFNQKNCVEHTELQKHLLLQGHVIYKNDCVITCRLYKILTLTKQSKSVWFFRHSWLTVDVQFWPKATLPTKFNKYSGTRFDSRIIILIGSEYDTRGNLIVLSQISWLKIKKTNFLEEKANHSTKPW